jgi:DNA-binding GntR family transcriptional regulator
MWNGGGMSRFSGPSERTGLREMVYQSLREAIVSMRISPGEPITEESLSKELDVSRPILRESLQRLQAEGMVERRSNGRVKVTEISLTHANNLYAARAALEEATVRQACELRTSAELRQLADTLSGLAVPTADAAAATGRMFHAQIAAIARNPVIDHLVDQLSGQIDRYRNLSVTESARPEESAVEHREILVALERGDADLAAAAMRKHITASRDSVLAAVQHSAAQTPA